jgi:hypothetical protein
MGGNEFDLAFKIDTVSGEYICPCGRRFPAFYRRKGGFGERRTMSTRITGAANFYRHLRKCQGEK